MVGYLDRNGKDVTNLKYLYGGDFSEGLAVVKTEAKRFACIAAALGTQSWGKRIEDASTLRKTTKITTKLSTKICKFQESAALARKSAGSVGEKLEVAQVFLPVMPQTGMSALLQASFRGVSICEIRSSVEQKLDGGRSRAPPRLSLAQPSGRRQR